MFFFLFSVHVSALVSRIFFTYFFAALFVERSFAWESN